VGRDIDYTLLEYSTANPNYDPTNPRFEVTQGKTFAIRFTEGEELKSVTQTIKGGKATDIPMNPVEKVGMNGG
jgi:hypothetical protein